MSAARETQCSCSAVSVSGVALGFKQRLGVPLRTVEILGNIVLQDVTTYFVVSRAKLYGEQSSVC